MSAAIYSFYKEGYITESNVNKSTLIHFWIHMGIHFWIYQKNPKTSFKFIEPPFLFFCWDRFVFSFNSFGSTIWNCLYSNSKDCIDSMIDEFTRITTTQRKEVSCRLDFWKNYEKLFPELAVLAKKFLSVQASSASCERMFSIAGHIFQCKRRRMSHGLFFALVFLKLNESLY